MLTKIKVYACYSVKIYNNKKLANFQTVWRAGHESAFVKLEEIILFVLFYA